MVPGGSAAVRNVTYTDMNCPALGPVLLDCMKLMPMEPWLLMSMPG